MGLADREVATAYATILDRPLLADDDLPAAALPDQGMTRLPLVRGYALITVLWLIVLLTGITCHVGVVAFAADLCVEHARELGFERHGIDVVERVEAERHAAQPIDVEDADRVLYGLHLGGRARDNHQVAWTPFEPPQALIERLGLATLAAGPIALFATKGCDACEGTGYRGRTVIAEVLVIRRDAHGSARLGAPRARVPATSATERGASHRTRRRQRTRRVCSGMEVGSQSPASVWSSGFIAGGCACYSGVTVTVITVAAGRNYRV